MDEHTAVVWRAYDLTFNKRDPQAARDCYADDYRCHMPTHPGPIDALTLEADVERHAG